MVETIVQTEISVNETTEYPTSNPVDSSKRAEPDTQTAESLFHRPKRVELSEEEVIKRMEEFPLRKDKFVAAIREGKNRSLYP